MKNTRSTLLTGVLCLFAITTFAQPRAGIKAGANYSSLTAYTGDKRVSIHAGIFVSVPISKQWSFHPELLYSGEGRHYIIAAVGDEPSESQGLISLDYAALPLMIRYNSGRRFYAETGPQFSVLVAAHSKGLGTDNMNMKRSFSNGQFALCLGAGMAVSPRIGIYGRYNFGMTDVTANSNNKSAVAQLGFSFKMGKEKATK